MIKIIDYKAGNAPSVMHAVTHLGLAAQFVRCAQDLAGASHIILPGVGSARATMDSLREMNIIAALEQAVLRDNTPFLGICVGMQILFDHSEEEDTPCLGWLPGRVVKFNAAQVRVPQMGWNNVRFTDRSSDYFYFVNSFYAKPQCQTDTWGTAQYQDEFTAAVRRDNVFGAQFHAEKSGEAGLALLGDFLKGELPC
ncbi:MAG: imidazole glycerol phosphate synthase subunit HisH [Oscillospiraceae bacterium]|nr:imidazole glycerol phosphate synthase subunit HisH [Oscillospiraceae bacterium]